jgi:hypothetical protein
MRALLHIDRRLRRVWVCGQRIHHGAVGAGMVCLGTLLCLHDKRDLRDWFRREGL